MEFYNNKQFDYKKLVFNDVVFHECAFFSEEDKYAFTRCSFYNCSFFADDVYMFNCSANSCTFDVKSVSLIHSIIHNSHFKNVNKTFQAVESSITWGVFLDCRPENGFISFSSIDVSHGYNSDFSAVKTDSSNKLNYPATKLNFPISQVCPKEGSFIAYKRLANGRIATLLIPEDAERVGSIERKCRASKVEVISIYDIATKQEVSQGESTYDNGKTIYTVGSTVYPNWFDNHPQDPCSNGIHFFMTREEALNY